MILDKKAKIKIGVGAFIIGLTALTLNYILKNVRRIIHLTFTYKNVDVNKINFREISLTMNWLCTNPSDFNFTIKNQVYDVFLNDVFVSKVGSSQDTEVYSRGTSIVKTNVYITTKEVLKLGVDNLSGFITDSGRKNTTLKVKGTFDVSTPLFTLRKLPFEFKDTIHNIINY
jgi:LEA14-like dessication related protein